LPRGGKRSRELLICPTIKYALLAMEMLCCNICVYAVTLYATILVYHARTKEKGNIPYASLRTQQFQIQKKKKEGPASIQKDAHNLTNTVCSQR
jgi:hypothetical protein